MTEARRSLLLVHVRKTGGTSLGGALGNRFPANECLSLYDREPPSAEAVRAHRFVAGHVDLTFLSNFAEPPVVVACLRDPVDRALSAYSFYSWFPERGYDVLRAALGARAFERRVEAMRLTRELSPAEFLERAPELAREHFGNVQTRILGGSEDAIGAESLEAALAGLKRCDALALTERLEDSAALLCRRLGWSGLGPLPRANELGGGLRRSELDADTLGALERITELDSALHARAAERLERDLRESSPGDLAAGLPDAPLGPEATFEGPVRGGTWYGRERVGGGPWFAWIGAEGRAWADLEAPPGARTLEIEVAHVISQPVLAELEVRVGERTLEHELRPHGSGLLLTAPLPEGLAAGPARVTIATPRLARPCDVAESEDRRLLSVAISRIALRS
ncbi:MAG: hypothetical protein ACXWGV_10355 [Solirubrobacterales bacterium]